ncbi:hypothetical protein CEXT_83521, partial [Caerostris extrusa]
AHSISVVYRDLNYFNSQHHATKLGFEVASVALEKIREVAGLGRS